MPFPPKKHPDKLEIEKNMSLAKNPMTDKYWREPYKYPENLLRDILHHDFYELEPKYTQKTKKYYLANINWFMDNIVDERKRNIMRDRYEKFMTIKSIGVKYGFKDWQKARQYVARTLEQWSRGDSIDYIKYGNEYVVEKHKKILEEKLKEKERLAEEKRKIFLWKKENHKFGKKVDSMAFGQGMLDYTSNKISFKEWANMCGYRNDRQFKKNLDRLAEDFMEDVKYGRIKIETPYGAFTGDKLE